MRIGADEAAYIPTGQVCKMLGVTRQRVMQLEREGRISGQLIEGRWVFAVRSIEARLALLEREAEEMDNDRRGF